MLVQNADIDRFVAEGVRMKDGAVLQADLVVLATGLLAMVVHRPYLDARWAWLKAALGLAMFEGTLGGIQAPAERGAALSARAAAGEVDPGALVAMINDEWNAMWLILALSLANVGIAIWTPRLKRRRQPAAA